MYTHLIGVIFAIIAFPILAVVADYSQNEMKGLSIIIFGCSFLFLYCASTIYHSAMDGKKKKLWRKIDHISIYFMISGSYVPYMFEYIDMGTNVKFLAFMYSLVLIGAILKIWFTGKFEYASMILYVFLGWMILFLGKTFFEAADPIVLAMVVAGGISYMLGIYFYWNDQRKYYHAIWHVFVLLGSIFHFSGVFLM